MPSSERYIIFIKYHLLQRSDEILQHNEFPYHTSFITNLAYENIAILQSSDFNIIKLIWKYLNKHQVYNINKSISRRFKII